jgi:hypothetical protein
VGKTEGSMNCKRKGIMKRKSRRKIKTAQKRKDGFMSAVFIRRNYE